MAMATYNGEQFLNEQIDSILSQNVEQELELVVCDDKSTDGTLQILRERQKADPRIRVYKNKKRLGFYKNFMRAIGLCKGEWIALSDQDDIWQTNKLQTLLQSVGQKDFACSNALLVDKGNKSLGYTMKESCGGKWIPTKKEDLFKKIVFGNIVQGSTMLARADFLKSCQPVPEAIKYHDHWFALCSCAQNGFVYVDQCLIRYRQHDSNQTINKKKDSFVKQLATLHTLQSSQKVIFEQYDKKIAKCNAILDNMECAGWQKDYLTGAIRYLEESKHKSFYSFLFFAKNCRYFCLDKNIFRNALRIAKRFAAMVWWKGTKAS